MTSLVSSTLEHDSLSLTSYATWGKNEGIDRLDHELLLSMPAIPACLLNTREE